MTNFSQKICTVIVGLFMMLLSAAGQTFSLPNSGVNGMQNSINASVIDLSSLDINAVDVNVLVQNALKLPPQEFERVKPLLLKLIELKLSATHPMREENNNGQVGNGYNASNQGGASANPWCPVHSRPANSSVMNHGGQGAQPLFTTFRPRNFTSPNTMNQGQSGMKPLFSAKAVKGGMLYSTPDGRTKFVPRSNLAPHLRPGMGDPRVACSRCKGSGRDPYSIISAPRYTSKAPASTMSCSYCRRTDSHTHNVCRGCGGVGKRDE